MFGRDRADLGPAAAAEQAAEDIERYGTQKPTRPLDEVLADLWAAWTRQADLHEQHQRLAGERDALQQVAAIQARYTPDRERLRGDEVDARRRWLQARQQVVDLEATLTSETADLQTRVWGAWRQELSQAQRAAEVVRDGAGRLGQHRRQVRDASAELTAFAARWHPALPDLATDPAELADQVMWLHGRRVEDPINAFVARAVADAHPDADQIRETERDAYAAYDRAERSRTPPRRGDVRRAAPVRPGRARARRRAADSPPSRTNWQVSNATCAPPRHGSMSSQREPASGRFPGRQSTGNTSGGPPTACARQEAASREANERRQRQQETRRIEPPLPEPEHSRPRAGHRPMTNLTDKRPQTMSDPVRKVLPFSHGPTTRGPSLMGRR